MFPRYVLRAAFLAAVSACAAPTAAPGSPVNRPPSESPLTYPPTRTSEARDVYHGVEVADPYRWLERLEDPEVTTWLRAQDRLARDYLAGLDQRATFLPLLEQADSARTFAGGYRRRHDRFFYLRHLPGAKTPVLFVRDGTDGVSRVLVDPNAGGGSFSSIDYFEPSPDGALVAYGVSSGGSEDSTLKVVRVSDGQLLADEIPHARYVRVAWHPDSQSFSYRLPNTDVPPSHQDALARMRVFRHVIGRAHADDVAIFGYGVSPDVAMRENDFPAVETTPLSPELVFGAIYEGTKKEGTLYVASRTSVESGVPRWRKVFDPTDEIVYFEARGTTLYALTHKDAPNYRMVKFDVSTGTPNRAQVVLGEHPTESLKALSLTPDSVYAIVRKDGIDELRKISEADGSSTRVSPPDTHVANVVAHPSDGRVYFQVSDWSKPPRLLEYDEADGTTREIPVEAASDDVIADLVVDRKLVEANGVRVPLTILYREGLPLDGTAPARISAYGAMGLTYTPYFLGLERVWIEQGGIIAFAHVRGGGAKGAQWQATGQRANKQNSVDDLIACAEYLVEHRYTSNATLAAHGASSGGVVAGAAAIQRPELFRAIVIEVGIVDLLRFETTAIGPLNVPEFGSVKIKEEFEAMRRVSPYGNVARGTQYPAFLLTGALNDSRVPVWQPAKLAAQLQQAGSRAPVLLRVELDEGHGLVAADRNKRVAWLADQLAFLHSMLRVE